MPMNVNCKFFESRSYPNGETVRKCDLDLAPEAPWRCPDSCKGFQPRLADVNWQHGDLVVSPTPPEPKGLGDDDSIAALLDSAEDIVNAVAPSALAEVQAERMAQQKRDNSKLNTAGKKITQRFNRLRSRFKRN